MIQETIVSSLSPLINGKVYALIAPQNTVPPYITFQRISKYDTQTMEGTESLDLARFQISIYSKKYSESVTLCESVKNALAGKALLIGHTEDYEEEGLLFSQKVDFKIS